MSARRTPRRDRVVLPLPAGSADGDLLARTGLLSAAAGVPSSHPDAKLLGLIAAFREARNRRDDTYAAWQAPPTRRTLPRKELQQLFLMAAEQFHKVELQVCSLPARTADGALAKLYLILDEHPSDEPIRGGTHFALPLSAMRDAVACGFPQIATPGQARETAA